MKATLTSILYCPACHSVLNEVKQPEDSPLNAEQYDSLKHGDYYCPVCPPNKEGLKYRYFNRTDAVFITDSNFDKVNLSAFSEEFVAACREMNLTLEKLNQSTIQILERVWEHGKGVSVGNNADIRNLLILQEKANHLWLSSTPPSEFGYEMVHLFMTSDLVQPRYKKLYEGLPK